MPFDGPAESFVAAWVNGRLGRKVKEAALSVQTDGLVSSLFSYAVPIASIYDQKYLIISEKSALERGSVTTSKHLRWVERAADHAPGYGAELFPDEQRAYLTQGRIPTTEDDWVPMLVMFDERNSGGSPSRLRGAR